MRNIATQNNANKKMSCNDPLYFAFNNTSGIWKTYYINENDKKTLAIRSYIILFQYFDHTACRYIQHPFSTHLVCVLMFLMFPVAVQMSIIEHPLEMLICTCTMHHVAKQLLVPAKFSLMSAQRCNTVSSLLLAEKYYDN